MIVSLYDKKNARMYKINYAILMIAKIKYSIPFLYSFE